MKDRKEYQKEYLKKWRKENKDIHIYFTPEEYKFFEELSKKYEIKTSPLIKTMAISQANKTLCLPKEMQEKLNEFVFLIRNIANNVNQIARHSNTVKTLTDEHGLLSYLKQLEEAVKEYVKKENK
jgi:hypothetical protein